MIVGFFAAYPVNGLLIEKDWKEKMPSDESELKSIPRASSYRPAA